MEVSYKVLLQYAEEQDICDEDTALAGLVSADLLPIYENKTEYLSELQNEVVYYTNQLTILGFKLMIEYMASLGIDKCTFTE